MTAISQEEKIADKLRSLAQDYQGNKTYVADRLLAISKSLAEMTDRVSVLEKSLPKIEIKHFEERVGKYIREVEELRNKLTAVEKHFTGRVEEVAQSLSGLSESVLPKEDVDRITSNHKSLLEILETINVNIQGLARRMTLFCEGEIQRLQNLRREFDALKSDIERRVKRTF